MLSMRACFSMCTSTFPMNSNRGQLHLDRNALHHDGSLRVVIGSWHLCNCNKQLKIFRRFDLAEDWVLGITWRKPVQEVVVHNVDEELRTSTVRLSRVGHRQCARFVAIP